MMGTPTLSICITVKNRSRLQIDGRELRLLPNCLKALVGCLRPEDDAELVISDWHSDDWPLEEWAEAAAKPIPLRVVQVDGHFSAGRGRNVAFEHARGDVLLFLDADIIVCRELFDRGLRYTAQGMAFYPIYFHYDDPEHKTGRWLPASHGNVMLTRETFLRAGKWPELKSWGREDDMLHDAVKQLGQIVRVRLPGMVHQWHPDTLAWKNRYADPRFRQMVGAR
ncbi:MAG TPA: glycosyltransferase family A protein [Planctomycetota bacterium]|nr:glycosyltransferase family A protein [Planctomycetota bacterium]